MYRIRREWPLTLLALLLVAVVAYVQRPGEPNPGDARAEMTGATVEPVGFSPLVGAGKVALWLNGQASGQVTHAQLIDAVQNYAQTAADRFRLALLVGELDGADARRQRLAALEKDLSKDSPLREDITTVHAIKAHEADPDAAPLPPPAKIDSFRTRHGWFAEMILSDLTPGGQAAFERGVVHDGMMIVTVLFLAFLWFGFAILSGIVLLIVAIVKLANGSLRARFVATPAEMGYDRGLWLETFCVFIAAFLALHAVHFGLTLWAGQDTSWTITAALILQWCLVATVFWPLLRGMSWERFRGELGWHRGRGFFREVGSGICGYFAGLPIYFATAVVVITAYAIVEAIKHAGAGGSGQREMPMPDNKVFDLVAHANGWQLLLLASLVVCWAPLVEESIFRGALFRHLRQRLHGPGGLALCIVLVASAFALAHQYILAGVLLVGTLGGIFVLMREWRGSLIAPMTAHCLHNGTVLLILITLLPLLHG